MKGYRTAFGFGMAALVATLLAVDGSTSAEAPAKPLSTGDEIRELKRRVDQAERDRAELQKLVREQAKSLENEFQARQEDAKAANRRIAVVEGRGRLDRVPLGAMIPYFGADDTPPKGYVWADGRATWPDADWVPVHLRRDEKNNPRLAHVPDMREHIIGGASQPTEVGLVWDKGEFPAASKKAEEMGRVPPSPSYPTLNLMAMVVPQSVGQAETYLATQTNHFFARIPIPAFEGFKLNTRDSNPRHVMCRWIIRVK